MAGLEAQLASLKDKGNALFVRRRWLDSVAVYTDAMDLFMGPKAEAEKGTGSPELRELKVSLLSNRAMALMNLGMYREALVDCDSSLSIQADHEKSLFRKAKCLQKLESFLEAMETAELLRRLYPKNSSAAALVSKLQKTIEGPKQLDPPVPKPKEKPPQPKQLDQTVDVPTTENSAVADEAKQNETAEHRVSQEDYATPRTGFEFLRVYREIIADRVQLSLFIQRIRPSKLPKFIAANLDSELLCRLVDALSTGPVEKVYPYLESLTKTPRFEMITMFLDSSEITTIRKSFDQLKKKNSLPQQSADVDLDTLLKRFLPTGDES